MQRLNAEGRKGHRWNYFTMLGINVFEVELNTFNVVNIQMYVTVMMMNTIGFLLLVILQLTKSQLVMLVGRHRTMRRLCLEKLY